MYLKPLYLVFLVILWKVPSGANATSTENLRFSAALSDSTETVILEPWTYSDDFEDRDLGAWASYPLWQDIAYNQNFRVNEIIPGDPNISIVQKVTPYTAVDNYAGAQKLLDMYLVPGASVKLRYYLKTNQNCDWIKVRFAAGKLGKIDVTLKDPVINEWRWITLDYLSLIHI